MPRRPPIRSLLLGIPALVGTLHWLSSPALAGEDTIRLTVDEAVRLAEAQTPVRDLDLARSHLERSRAWLPANPYLTAGGGSTTIAGVAPSQFLFLSQQFEIAGQRRLRVAAATAGLRQEEWDHRSAALNRGARARAFFVSALANRERVALARENLEVTTRLVRSLSPEGSAAARIVYNSAVVQEQRARLDIAGFEQAYDDALDGLRQACGLPVSARIEPLGTVGAAILPVAPLDVLVQRARDRRPDLVARRHALERAAREVDLARRGRIPNVSLGTGVTRYQDGETVWAGDVGVSLPVFDRGDEAVRDALTEQSEARRVLAELEESIAREVHDAYRSLSVSAATLQAHTAEIVPRSEENTRLERELYAAGVADATDLMGFEIDLLAARRSRLDAIENYNLSRIELERVTAGNIDP